MSKKVLSVKVFRILLGLNVGMAISFLLTLCVSLYMCIKKKNYKNNSIDPKNVSDKNGFNDTNKNKSEDTSFEEKRINTDNENKEGIDDADGDIIKDAVKDAVLDSAENIDVDTTENTVINNFDEIFRNTVEDTGNNTANDTDEAINSNISEESLQTAEHLYTETFEKQDSVTMNVYNKESVIESENKKNYVSSAKRKHYRNVKLKENNLINGRKLDKSTEHSQNKQIQTVKNVIAGQESFLTSENKINANLEETNNDTEQNILDDIEIDGESVSSNSLSKISEIQEFEEAIKHPNQSLMNESEYKTFQDFTKSRSFDFKVALSQTNKTNDVKNSFVPKEQIAEAYNQDNETNNDQFLVVQQDTQSTIQTEEYNITTDSFTLESTTVAMEPTCETTYNPLKVEVKKHVKECDQLYKNDEKYLQLLSELREEIANSIVLDEEHYKRTLRTHESLNDVFMKRECTNLESPIKYVEKQIELKTHYFQTLEISIEDYKAFTHVILGLARCEHVANLCYWIPTNESRIEIIMKFILRIVKYCWFKDESDISSEIKKLHLFLNQMEIYPGHMDVYKSLEMINKTFCSFLPQSLPLYQDYMVGNFNNSFQLLNNPFNGVFNNGSSEILFFDLNCCKFTNCEGNLGQILSSNISENFKSSFAGVINFPNTLILRNNGSKLYIPWELHLKVFKKHVQYNLRSFVTRNSSRTNCFFKDPFCKKMKKFGWNNCISQVNDPENETFDKKLVEAVFYEIDGTRLLQPDGNIDFGSLKIDDKYSALLSVVVAIATTNYFINHRVTNCESRFIQNFYEILSKYNCYTTKQFQSAFIKFGESLGNTDIKNFFNVNFLLDLLLETSEQNPDSPFSISFKGVKNKINRIELGSFKHNTDLKMALQGYVLPGHAHIGMMDIDIHPNILVITFKKVYGCNNLINSPKKLTLTGQNSCRYNLQSFIVEDKNADGNEFNTTYYDTCSNRIRTWSNDKNIVDETVKYVEVKHTFALIYLKQSENVE